MAGSVRAPGVCGTITYSQVLLPSIRSPPRLLFTLLLDEVGRKIEPSYRLKERWLRGEVDDARLKSETETARKQLASAPIVGLFRIFAQRVRSRGELGELSSLNQKIWLQYRESERFLDEAGTMSMKE